ncbi:hypothetical protein ACF0H5_000119 [Mactra antiquata]
MSKRPVEDSSCVMSQQKRVCPDNIQENIPQIGPDEPTTDLSQQGHIWCIGSSIVKQAFIFARNNEIGIDLGLKDRTVWWQGYSGLSLLSLQNKIQTLFKVGETPSCIILHCGGNDIGKTSLYRIRTLISLIFEKIINLLPNVTIIWSEILPRQNWRYSNNNKSMERCRKRINSYAGKLAITKNGRYLRHSFMCINISKFLKTDGVHLNDNGNKLLLQQFKKAVVE